VVIPTVHWTGDALEILDQTRLPEEEVVLRLTTADEVIDALQRLAVRGAPAIGVAGAFGAVLAPEEAERIASARPTAHNLRWAVERVMRADDREAEAIAIWREDIEACRRIGAFGAAELPGSRFLTICNAGRLATTGIGTALAPVYAKASAGEPVEVFACETRPLRQGARLTAWELADAGVPVTVLPDGAAGALLASGRVDAVITGCDRVAANGDVANKIGTFGLAIAARHHGVPFYVLGPRSTLDVATSSGANIEIEQRAASEIAVADGASVWNPAFDVTPSALVTALITDAGVLREPYGPAIENAVSGGVAGGS
jgi:methylthioribose-1-phosphate isomerase